MPLTLHQAVAAPRRPATPAAGAPGHKELVDGLVDRLVEPAAEPDLVLLAYAAADVNGHQTVASYLNMRTGGRAHSFAVSGAGTGTPFTALRIADAYARLGRGARVLIALVERAGAANVAARDSSVLLALGHGGPQPAGAGAPSVGEVARFDRPDALAAALARLVPGRGRLLVVRGPGLVALTTPDGPVDVHRVAPGSRATSVWLALARHWSDWAGRYPAIALCDAEPGPRPTSYLAVVRDPSAVA